MLALGVCLLAVAFPARGVTTNFAGRTWEIRTWEGAPGPNLWSTNCVWVDTNGWLHLAVKKIGADWYCGEVRTTNSLGYGEYRWYVVGRPDDMDTNAVGGLFTYEYVPGGENEIDIEFTKSFTEDPRTNLHYTIQPYYVDGHQYQGAMALTNEETTHRFTWTPGRIRWESWYGHTPEPPDTNSLLGAWTYVSNDVPPEAAEKVYMNLWMFLGQTPVETGKLELVIKDFTYTASTGTVLLDEFADGTMSNIWAVLGDGGAERLVETNDMLRINPLDENWTSLGYRTGNTLGWAAGGLEYVFSACLRTVTVTSAGTNGPIDLNGVQAIFDAPNAGIYDAYWASNAVTLKSGYDAATDELRVELYTKTNWPLSWGYLQFSGTITNLASYGDTNGLELQVVLRDTNYAFRAFYRTNAVAFSTNSGSSAGAHGLGSSLFSSHYELAAQNENAGRGYLYWNRTRVFSQAGAYSNAAPPVATNPPTVVQVGEDTTTWRYPLDTKYKKSRVQVLYLGDQIDHSGYITQLEVYVAGKPRIPLSNFTVRLQGTAVSVLSNRWVDNGWSTGYRQTVTIPAAGWYAFALTNRFYYNSASNLLVDFSVNNTKTKYPYAYARYSASAFTQCLARSDNDNTDPLTWTGTDPASPDESVLTACVINVRFTFEPGTNETAVSFGLRDEFDDTAMGEPWGYVGNWDGAEFAEADGCFRAKPGAWDWQTSGYAATNAQTWDDATNRFVFCGVLSTIRVDTAVSGEDLRTILSVCSEPNNAWYVTNSASLQGRYDAESNRLDVLFFTKTLTPSNEGTLRFEGAISNASAYLDGTDAIQMRMVLGRQRYALRFSDRAGVPIPVTTNSGSAQGDHNLGSHLHRCYWIIGAQNTVTGRGSVFWDRTVVATSAPPAAQILAAAQSSTDGQGWVTITNTYFDPDGDPGVLCVEASTNGGTSWFRPWAESVSGVFTASVASPQEAWQIVRVASTNGGGAATNTLAIVWDTKDAGNGADLSSCALTNVRVRITPDDSSLAGPAVTSAVVALDNAPPSPAGASVTVEDGAAWTLDAALDTAWSGFADEGSAVAGYYYDLADHGGTTSGTWTADASGVATGAVADATNTVHVWGRDSFGNIGAAASDAILVLSGGGDWDADGLTNAGESAYGCSPLNADSDGDELPDGWEAGQGLDPTNRADAAGDADFDLYSNHDEYFWGTDPNEATSEVAFAAGAATGAPFVVSWNSATARCYTVFFADGGFSNGIGWLAAPSLSNAPGVQGTMTYTDENAAAESRFFRLGVRLP